MKTTLSHILLAASAALALAAPAAAEVFVVSQTPGPEVDFFTLQPAIDAAADGDVLLVLAGGNFTLGDEVEIAGKSLVIQTVKGPNGELGRIGGLLVRDVPAGKSVLVRGLQIRASGDLSFFDLVDCEGAVMFEDCLIEGFQNLNPAIRMATVTNSSHVVFTHCTLKGSGGSAVVGSFNPASSTPGGPGLVVDGSSVSLYDCEVAGGNGAIAFFYFDMHAVLSTAGGQGVQVWSDSTLNLVGSHVRGGAGGAGSTQLASMGNGCIPAKAGGAGIRTFGFVRRLDSIVEGGLGGAGTACAPTPGADGLDIVLLGSGSVTGIAETARGLQVSSPLEDGGPVSVNITGVPGEFVVLLQGVTPSGGWHAGLKGALASLPPWATFVLGPVGIDGTLAFELTLPANLLPPGIEAVTVVDQLVTAAAGGGGLLSAPTIVTIFADLP